MRLKEGVLIKGIKAETVLGIMLVDSIYRDTIGKNNLVITSISDGQHMKNSKHYSGFAFDIRTIDLTEDKKQHLFRELKFFLNYEFDVVLEKTHIHIEYDPKY